jgi:hypothetical protein
MKRFRALEACAFCLVALLIFVCLNDVFKTPDYRIHGWITKFYDETPQSLDVVAIGPSSMYTFWQPALAWDAFGVASWNLTTPGMPYTAPIQMVKEALKTQTPKVFMVEAGTFLNEPSPDRVHNLSDFLPWSKEKLALIDTSCSVLGVEGFDRLEYFLPIVRFHSRWYELKKEDFGRPREAYKSSSYYKTFLKKKADFEYDYEDAATSKPIDDFRRAYLTEFLDYCKANGLEVVFVAAPNTKDNKGELRYMRDVVEGYGYPFVMTVDHMEEIGLVIPDDFFNENHTNLSGSIKCIAWFGKYLKERYDIPDHRGEKGYESWDKAANEYLETIEPYVEPRELEVLELA